MEKQFDPTSFEQRWRERWRDGGYYKAEAPSERGGFCIMIPPPNVTGKLHLGHALQTALQDLLTRWKRMQGLNALWLPGTDHAGIATQLMVERQLAEEGTSREEIGREAFLERMWRWKSQYHDNIRQQLERLGASCDWSRERFTLDEGLNRAVREAFVRLYDEGLIYRGEYMVNWSPKLDTAISDLEVEMRTVQGHLWTIAYPLEGGGDERVMVATTRPETMLGDTAVAFNPNDERYRHLEGKAAILPIVGRRIPFVADEAVEPEFGTGLVKVTPFHDPADFQMGQRHGLPRIQVIGRDGRMSEDAGEEFAGLDRFEAREKVVERLREEGYLVKVEKYTHNVGHSERSDEPVEPLVSNQWFCDVSGMAKRALEAVRSGEITLVPGTWEKTWEHWLENIKPWCISRQLWWGHQIPAWYTPDGEVVVARTEEEAREKAAARGLAGELRRDEDVLDTWFSSGLWPFSTLGWPEESEDLSTFYPTDVLITAHDILFFWVARMVMMGYHFTGREPFHTVHLTGLVRDAEGQKMSKTRGNVLDPSDLVDEYGADAVRFTLTILDSPGRDIPLDQERMAGYRAFGNKIWNAARFALTRLEGSGARVVADDDALDPAELAAPERWILSRFSRAAAEVNERFETFRFDEACNRLYHFFWGELCDWYIELTKPALLGGEAERAARPRVGDVLLSVLDRSLRLLHPVMPFLTEEVWQRLPGHDAVHPDTVSLAPYPGRHTAWEDEGVEERMGAFMEVVTRIRSMAHELGIRPGQGLSVHLEADDEETRTLFADQRALLEFLLPLGASGAVELGAAPDGASRDLVAGVGVGLVPEAVELGEEERERLEAELEKIEGEIGRARGRLSNEQFLSKAPAEIVEGNKKRLAELEQRREQIVTGLER